MHDINIFIHNLIEDKEIIHTGLRIQSFEKLNLFQNILLTLNLFDDDQYIHFREIKMKANWIKQIEAKIKNPHKEKKYYMKHKLMRLKFEHDPYKERGIN